MKFAEKNLIEFIDAVTSPKIDKVKHFVVSFAMMLIIQAMINVYVALIVTVCVGIAKEVYDGFRKNGSGFSFADLFYDYAGAISGMATYGCYLLWRINC